MSFADKMTIGTYNFVSWIVKIMLFELALAFSGPSTDKLMSDSSSHQQKSLRYFNDKTVVLFSKTPFASFRVG